MIPPRTAAATESSLTPDRGAGHSHIVCGITGFLSPDHNLSAHRLREIARSMADAIAHRGPDLGAEWVDERQGVAIGHRRLSIIDLSPEGHQPMVSSSGRYVMAYNGEIYNFADIRRRLESSGRRFRGHSDTEVLTEAVDAWGFEAALAEINGMFAFAVWDREARRLHFARDRFGKKPLYVGWAGRDFVFSSELKAVSHHPGFEGRIDRGALARYMQYACVPAPYSIFEGVRQLPAGFMLTVELDAVKDRPEPLDLMRPYWHHAETLQAARLQSPPISEEEAIEGLESRLEASVRERLVSDVPLGAFLSGGIDSSTVVAMMAKTADGPVRTYSIGFAEAGFDEAPYARKVAARLGTEHHELYVSARQALDTVPRLPEIYDEPFADISQIPTFLLAEFARTGVTVALSGDGGDEMLGGYARHFAGPRIRRLTAVVPRPLRRAAAGAIRRIPVERWNRLAPRYPQLGDRAHKAAGLMAARDERAIYARLAGHWTQPRELVLVDGAAELPPLLLDRPGWKVGDLTFAERMMYWDALTYLPNDILVKVDRATMAVSLEARAPLLDTRIWDYVWSLPLHYKIRGGEGKWLLKQVLARYLPMDLFERPKQGFNMPVGRWLRGPLRDWAESLLKPARLQAEGYLDAETVKQLWDHHLAGRGNYATRLWTVLMFEAWLERWGR